MDEGNYGDAIKAFTEAIELEENAAGAYVKRAETYIALDSLEEAKNDYESAINVDDHSIDSYLGLSELYLQEKETKKAIELLQSGFDVTKDKQLSEKLQCSEITKELYVEYLENHPPQEIISVAGYYPENKEYVNYYLVRDINHDGFADLLTFTGVNFRYTIHRVFENKNGKLQSFKDENGEDLELHLDSEAMGRMWIELCEENHIHQMWEEHIGGHGGTAENVYLTDGTTVKPYMYSHNNIEVQGSSGKDGAVKCGKPISIREFEQLSKECNQQCGEWIDNTEANRSKMVIR